MCCPQIWLCLFTFRSNTLKHLNSLTTIVTLSWLGGAEVTHPLWVPEVPDSIPGFGKGFYVWFLYPHHKMWGGGAILDSLCPVGRSVRPSVYNSCPLYNSFTNGRISFKLEWHVQSPCCWCVSSRSRSQLKIKYLTNKYNVLHIMSCPLYNSFTNGRISFKLKWQIHLN